MINFYQIIFILAIIFMQSSFAILAVPNLNEERTLHQENNSIIDPKVDYEKFAGRVTDKDSTGRILKVQVEVNNTKFFKTGDVVYFRVNRHDTELPCRAQVKSVEEKFFSMYVTDFNLCWKSGKYLPRGVQMNFESEVLAQRILEASKYRSILLLRKEGFLSQLSNINNFLWTYDQQKLKVAADFDRRISELKKEKQKAIDNLLQTKQENILIQSELMTKLNDLDENLDHYRVERGEYLLDRWNLDHDLGAPFPQRPMDLKDL